MVLGENKTFQKKLQNSVLLCCWGFLDMEASIFFYEISVVPMQVLCNFLYEVFHNLAPIAFKATSEGAI